jgi:hypothetical protein
MPAGSQAQQMAAQQMAQKNPSTGTAKPPFSILTPMQLNAGAGLLQNQGLAINPTFLNTVEAYTSTSLITPLATCIANAISNGAISNSCISSLTTMAGNICPALADSVPKTYTNDIDGDVIVGNAIVGFTGFLEYSANIILGGGDVSKFCQAFSQAQGYLAQTSTFVNSAVNGQNYLGNTFTSVNSMITGGIAGVNLATPDFGADLSNLGQLINLSNLDNLGSPLALVQQIYKLAGTIPFLSVAFTVAGVPEDVVVNLSDPNASVTDSVQKLMYDTMTQITGDILTQILTALNVKTVGITTMADLLNPVKLFPNSFQSLTVPGLSGTIPIYTSSTGTINSELATQLPSYVLSSIV